MISILIPAYNAENTIRRCIDSILCQSYSDIEIIIVNDGSTDKTLSILLEYKTKDNRIIVCNQINSGVAAARNAALEKAKGEYILYVDADDWIEPNMLERMIKLINGYDIVFCSNDNAENINQVHQRDGIHIETWDNNQQMFEFMKHTRMTGMLWNKLIRRDLTAGIQFNVNTGYGEDAEFLWQIVKKSKTMVVTNEILYHHVLESTSISHLSFSDKKYSAIPMWEKINKEVKDQYPELLYLAKERLMSACVFSMYEAKKTGYKNKGKMKHMRKTIRENILVFLKSDNVSKKFKLYALAICVGW